MAKELNFEANDRIINDVLFQNYVFKIPRYQRPYTWSEDQLTEFWNDFNEDDESFFLGSFVLITSPSKRKIILKLLMDNREY